MNKEMSEMRIKRAAYAALVAAGVVFGVAACGDAGVPPDGPLPDGANYVGVPYNGFNAGFYTACDHGHRFYYAWTSSGVSVDVVPNDPSCRGL